MRFAQLSLYGHCRNFHSFWRSQTITIKIIILIIIHATDQTAVSLTEMTSCWSRLDGWHWDNVLTSSCCTQKIQKILRFGLLALLTNLSATIFPDFTGLVRTHAQLWAGVNPIYSLPLLFKNQCFGHGPLEWHCVTQGLPQRALLTYGPFIWFLLTANSEKEKMTWMGYFRFSKIL